MNRNLLLIALYVLTTGCTQHLNTTVTRVEYSLGRTPASANTIPYRKISKNSELKVCLIELMDELDSKQQDYSIKLITIDPDSETNEKNVIIIDGRTSPNRSMCYSSRMVIDNRKHVMQRGISIDEVKGPVERNELIDDLIKYIEINRISDIEQIQLK